MSFGIWEKHLYIATDVFFTIYGTTPDEAIFVVHSTCSLLILEIHKSIPGAAYFSYPV